MLAASEVLDDLRERQEAAVAAEEAVARSLAWQLQARTHRHRREDLAPWIAMVLCFGVIPVIGPVAIVGGYLVGNWTLAGAAVGIPICLAPGGLLAAYPLVRHHRLRVFRDTLAALDARADVTAGTDPAGAIAWLEDHWSGDVPTEAFLQGRMWGFVVARGALLIINLRRVNRSHPCQAAALWLVPHGVRAPIPEWPARASDAGVIYLASSADVRRTRPSQLGRWIPGEPLG